MKRIFTIGIAVIALSLFSTKAQAQVEKGSIIIEPYYGYSLFSTAIMESYERSDAPSSSYKGLGPMGIRFEYFVSDLIGLGIDANYKSLELSQDYLSDANTYTETFTSKQIRVMARMNFHFVRTEKVDFYAGYGIGYKSNSWGFTDTNPNSIHTDFDALIPVAFRMSTGVRYFFTDNIGANLEIGFAGGSLATAGITIKL